jgi:hypothetical protein
MTINTYLKSNIKRKRGTIRAVQLESESEGILGGVRVSRNVPTPNPTSV